MIPTSIDGTDITGATIDGQDVEEITVDGQTVFSAESLPVGYSNLIAWYPFDSSFYGGSDADDVTALFNPGQSGDSTAYDGTVKGASYQSTGGVTDINAGQVSGGYDFDDANDEWIETFTQTNVPDTVTYGGWVNYDTIPNQSDISCPGIICGLEYAELNLGTRNGTFNTRYFDGSSGHNLDSGVSPNTGEWYHVMGVVGSGSGGMRCYVDGILEATNNVTNTPQSIKKNGGFALGHNGGSYTSGTEFYLDGQLDDIRVYNTPLTDAQVEDIYNNTKPPSKP